MALSLFGPDLACTAHAVAVVVEDPLAEAERVAGVRLDVTGIQDHRQSRFSVEEGVRWRWTDAEGAARDAEVRAGLRRLAALHES